jgi:Cu-Zn family superoxide dismutase
MEVKKGVVVVTVSFGVSGSIVLEEVERGRTRFTCDLEGLSPGKHGMHVHESGDLRKGCNSGCDHYNPTGSLLHGDREGKDRHRGDLGNVEADSSWKCKSVLVAEVGVEEVIGRMIVIHANEDDLGKGGTDVSRKNGTSGDRIACGVIGRM